jgi:hypothetical protein
MNLGWIPPTRMLDEILQQNLTLRKDNHVVFTRMLFHERFQPEEGMAEHSVLAQRVADLMPKTIAMLIEKGNEDTFFQTRNNNAYHLSMDMVNAYVKDFVNRTVFHCVHFWRNAVPAPGITPARLTDKDVIHFVLDLDITAQGPGGPMYCSRLLTVRMGLQYPHGFMTYFKTDPISV